jgi:hypothetical protein
MQASFLPLGLAITACLGIPLSSSAQAAQEQSQRKCMEASEVSNLGVALLPAVISKISDNCGLYLPADASLNMSAPRVAAEYHTKAIAARPAAYQAIKMLVGDKLPPEMSADALFPFAEAMISGELGKMVGKKECQVANNIWSALEPLPLENWGMIVAAIVSADSIEPIKKSAQPSDEKSKTGFASAAKFPICAYMATEH